MSYAKFGRHKSYIIGYVGFPKSLGAVGPIPWDMDVADPKHMPPTWG